MNQINKELNPDIPFMYMLHLKKKYYSQSFSEMRSNHPLKLLLFLEIDCNLTFRSASIQSTTDGEDQVFIWTIRFTQMYIILQKKMYYIL